MTSDPYASHGGLDGGLVVVTGAAGGIGRAIVEMLLDAGAHVVGVDEAAADDVAAETFYGVVGDVTDESTVASAFTRAEQTGTPLVGLVTCAFAEQRGLLEELDRGGFARTLDVVVTAAWRWATELVRRLEARPGTIVHLSSVHAVRAAAEFGPYAAGKAALLSLTRSMAVEWGPRGIRCNAVLPGLVPVPRNRAVWADDDRLQPIVEATPLRRLVTPAEVAAVTRFLLSPESSAVTGACIPVDGGSLARLSLRD